jgi:hypothetical protein
MPDVNRRLIGAIADIVAAGVGMLASSGAFGMQTTPTSHVAAHLGSVPSFLCLGSGINRRKIINLAAQSRSS